MNPSARSEASRDLKVVSLGPEIAAEVTVSTASAIICSAADPYMVLVAHSAKHPRPVIPGGKVELTDLSVDGGRPGLSCVLREVEEEVGTQLLNPTYIGSAEDPERDVRCVPATKLATALVEPPLPPGIASDAIVKARYGCPDYIFVGQVDESKLTATEELKGLNFIDIRRIGPADLSAGHGVILIAYRTMLEQGLPELPAGALKNFQIVE